LTHLIFIGSLNQTFEKEILPESLIHLKIYGNYRKEIREGVLPRSLEELLIQRDYNFDMIHDSYKHNPHLYINLH